MTPDRHSFSKVLYNPSMVASSFPELSLICLTKYGWGDRVSSLPMMAAATRGGVRIDQSVLCSRLPPNSYVMVQYKTFDLKHYIVFVKIKPPTGQITF